ncbi:MAG: hypothetical protein ABFS34_16150 [Gemmatimonadota bacterium]
MTKPKSAVIDILRPDGSTSPAVVEWWTEYTESERIRHVDILFQGGSYRGSAGDYFGALMEARPPLEHAGYRLLCYGASRNVWASGMARCMAQGLLAVLHGRPFADGPVHIFETGPEVVPATVDEQMDFLGEWLDENAEIQEARDRERGTFH